LFQDTHASGFLVQAKVDGTPPRVLALGAEGEWLETEAANKAHHLAID
jgi:hypothetical protein